MLLVRWMPQTTRNGRLLTPGLRCMIAIIGLLQAQRRRPGWLVRSHLDDARGVVVVMAEATAASSDYFVGSLAWLGGSLRSVDAMQQHD